MRTRHPVARKCTNCPRLRLIGAEERTIASVPLSEADGYRTHLYNCWMLFPEGYEEGAFVFFRCAIFKLIKCHEDYVSRMLGTRYQGYGRSAPTLSGPYCLELQGHASRNGAKVDSYLL